MAILEKLIPTENKGVFYIQHPTRKYNAAIYDRRYVIRQSLGRKLRLSIFGWISEGVQKGDILNRAQEYKTNFKWNKLNPDQPQKPICKADEDALSLHLAEEEIKKKKLEAEEKKLEAEKLITFADYFNQFYIPYHKGEKKSLMRECGIFKNHLAHIIGELNFNQITKDHLQQIKNEAYEKKLSDRSVKYHLNLARQVWNRAMKDGRTVEKFPDADIKKVKVDNKRQRYLNQGEEEGLLEALAAISPLEHDMTLLALDAGGRWGEIAALRWEHISFDDGGTLLFTKTKSGVSRVIPTTKRIKEMLLRRSLDKQSPFIFPAKDGGIRKYQQNIFAGVVRELGFNDEVSDRKMKITFHSCRHTFASRLVNKGVPLNVVKELLGHSTIVMTERYSHLSEEVKRDAIGVLDAQQIPKESLPERAAKAIAEGYHPEDVVKWAMAGGEGPLPEKRPTAQILQFQKKTG